MWHGLPALRLPVGGRTTTQQLSHHDNRIGRANCRIGFRHPGGAGTSNAAIADGHVQGIEGNKFPRAFGTGNDPAEVIEENSHGKPTVYANPDRSLRQ